MSPAQENKYPHIFSPGRIGILTTKNRIKYAATETNFPYGDGFVSDREVAYMEAQAHGGAGIVTTQGAYPDSKGEGKGFKGMMSIADDCFIPGLARIAESIKRHGALGALQILHCGREGGVELDYCLMPSVVPQKLSYFKPPREMTYYEIKKTIQDHIKAARRAVDAGFDIIEISGIVGYLISTFISRYTNKRKDEYGGDSIRSRCRLMVEVLQGIKSEVGRDVPVGIRLCGLELLDDRGGNTMEESIESFRLAEEAGADYVSVTIGWHESSQSVITRDVPMGHWLYAAKEIKKFLTIPVMMAFRLFTPEIPEKAISDGIIDFWEMCRPMIADPELPNKIKNGKEDEIIPCIACNLCFSRLYYHQPIMCTVRPTLGHEQESDWGYYGFTRTKQIKKVIVVGGGSAGLQCAVVAAQRGHKVTLFEKNHHLGGNILLASRIDEGAIELLKPINALETFCRKNGVMIHLGVEVTPEIISNENVDTVVIAKGANVNNFNNSNMVLTPHDVIEKGILPEKRIIIAGGGGVGLAIAVFLLRHGIYEILIIEETGIIGRDVNPFYLWQYIRLLKKYKVNVFVNTYIEKIDGKDIYLAHKKEQKIFENYSLISALLVPSMEWIHSDNKIAQEIFFIGDAKRPRRLHNAIHDGYRLGMVI